jgi:chromosome segregation ATPase
VEKSLDAEKERYLSQIELAESEKSVLNKKMGEMQSGMSELEKELKNKAEGIVEKERGLKMATERVMAEEERSSGLERELEAKEEVIARLRGGHEASLAKLEMSMQDTRNEIHQILYKILLKY